MTKRTQMLAMWCGPLTIALFTVGLWFVAGLVPPPPPTDSAQQIARMYQEHSGSIRTGMIMLMLGSALIGPFTAEISTQMRRIQPSHSPLATIQYGMGVAGIFVILLPAMTMQVAAFRPDRNPDIILALNDAAWLPFLGIFSLFVVQCAAIAICILQDSNKTVFPRWVGYFNVWAALLLAPATLIYYFKTGPFAWNGILVFWVGFAVLGAWFAVMSVALRNAILSQDDQPHTPGITALHKIELLSAEVNALRQELVSASPTRERTPDGEA